MTDIDSTIKDIETYFDRLWPICRSITGDGLRESLQIIQDLVPLKISEVPSGTEVFDWVVPDEWNIKDAYIIRPDGIKICDFHINNLHVVNYSLPIEQEISYDELAKRLHYIEELPEAIPYYTSYYKPTWGFCISYKEFKALPKEGLYKVVIKSSLKRGSLTYGEAVLKGSSDREVLFSTYLCHPSMANNELSGPLVQAFLYKRIAALKKRKFTYRFLFAPETIGVITYLHKNGLHLKKHMIAGYILTCCGDPGIFHYKRSRRGNTVADVTALHVLKYSAAHECLDFAIGGSDERQYCSPGFDLPVGSLMRTPYQRFKEYHTSLDNKEFISFSALAETIEMYFKIVQALELNTTFKSLNPFCEPQLGKRNLYFEKGGKVTRTPSLSKRLHLLAFADSTTPLNEIADKLGMCLLEFEDVIDELTEARLIERLD